MNPTSTRLPLLAPLLLAAFSSTRPALAQPAQIKVEVDPSIEFQKFEGWGVSLAWWAKVIGGFPEPARTDYLNRAFDAEKGLGLNVVRYNIGGGENPQYLPPNQRFLEYRTDMPGFKNAAGQWNWNADANQRYVLRAAIARGANHLEAFSNSPPYWMTKSGSVTGNRPNEVSLDNLKPEFDAAFADYLADVLVHFRDVWNIRFRTLAPLNEPSGTWWKFGNHQEGCFVERPHQNTVLKLSAAALKKRGLSPATTVSASDESVIEDANKTFPFYDAAAMRDISQINTHSYGEGDRTRLWNSANSSGKKLWLSEYGDGDASGMQMSRRILSDMNGLHPLSWCYWQIVDNAGGWGFFKNPMLDEANTAYQINKKYFVMGQYSRFIRPGARFIAIGDPNSLAAIDPTTRRLSIVSTNDTDAPRRMSFDLSRFNRLPRSVGLVRTSPTEEWARLPEIPIMGKRFSVTLPAKSVSTFVVSNARYSGPRGHDFRRYFELSNVASKELARAAFEDKTEASPPREGERWQRQWAVVGVGGGFYKIVNRRSGLVLDVSRSSTTSGDEVIPYSYNGGANQQWKLQAAGKGSWKIINRNSTLLLCPASGPGAPASGLVQQADRNTPSQMWRFIKVVSK